MTLIAVATAAPSVKLDLLSTGGRRLVNLKNHMIHILPKYAQQSSIVNASPGST